MARTGNVDSNELYTFFTNDTNAFNNIVSISGQVFKIKMCVGVCVSNSFYFIITMPMNQPVQ